MISEAYLWIWLPGATEPVVCGKLEVGNSGYGFVYGRSYLARPDAITLDPVELPLEETTFTPLYGETHRVIRDAAPDAWGRRVLLYRSNSKSLTELDFLLLSGNDRIGALDVISSPNDYKPKIAPPATLDDLFSAAQAVDAGKELPEELGHALLHGSSVGGARPKALLDAEQHKWIAKFSSTTDYYPVVRSEYAAMWLAGQCGIEVPVMRLMKILGKDVLLVRRFDREWVKEGWQRRFVVSALTVLQLHETEAILASYPELAAFIRRFGTYYPADAQQLYRRMVFNILVGNTDDHARNHAFFWDGKSYTLTPAYDICPMFRVGQTANQAMIVGTYGRESSLRNALSQAEQFGLTPSEAREVNEAIVETMNMKWKEAVEYAAISKKESEMLRQTTVLSPACFY